MASFPAKTLALLVRLLVGLVLLIAAVGLTFWLVATKPQASKSGIGSQPVRVQVMRVEPVEVARQWRGYGTTQAKDTADVPARVGAVVLEVPEAVEVGRVVAKGQTLARLDPTDFNNALDAAEKRIAEADASLEALAVERSRLEERLALEQQTVGLLQDDYDMQVARFEANAASGTDVNRVQRTLINAQAAALATRQQIDLIPARRLGLQAQRAAARADRDTAKANVKRTVITSPIDGVIQSLDIEAGENLAPGQRVARVIDPRTIELPLQLPASARGYVTKGNAVTLTTRGTPEGCPPWKASVTRIGPVDEPTRTFTVFAEVDQAQTPLRSFAEGGGPHKLAAGAFTMARLDTAEAQPRIIVPARAVQEGRVRTVVGGAIVGKAVRVAFEIEGAFEGFGLPDTQWVVLQDALKPGELVVLNASMTILDGQPVEPALAHAQAGSQVAEDAGGGTP